jgi:hypothetical protein
MKNYINKFVPSAKAKASKPSFNQSRTDEPAGFESKRAALHQEQLSQKSQRSRGNKIAHEQELRRINLFLTQSKSFKKLIFTAEK